MRSRSQLANELRDRVLAHPQLAGNRGGPRKENWPQHAAERRPGDASPARYVGAALLNGAVSVTFLLLAAHYLQPHQRILTRANLLTLSRAGSAGLLAGRTAAPLVGRRIAWMALLWGGSSDWLDGRLPPRIAPVTCHRSVCYPR